MRTILRVVLFLTVALVSLMLTELLVVACQRRWYEKSGDSVIRSCESVQSEMSPDQVWREVKERREPHGRWKADRTLGFWGSRGSCTISLDPNTNRVVHREYSETPGNFEGIR